MEKMAREQPEQERQGLIKDGGKEIFATHTMLNRDFEPYPVSREVQVALQEMIALRSPPCLSYSRFECNV